MSAKDTGGQAFPQNVHHSERGVEWVESVDGMDLRDYFAAKAMQGLLSCGEAHDESTTSITARAAYAHADAMLAARKEAT